MRMVSSEITRSVSKMDITKLENQIKVLEKQICTIQDKHSQVQVERQAAERKAHYFGTVQKENQVRRIKFLDNLDSANEPLMGSSHTKQS
jgi:uncharacterized protein (DUF3084 family)